MIRRVASLVVLVVVLALAGQATAGAASGRLIIPKIGVNAQIVKVGLKNGTLAVGDRLQGTVYTWRQGDPPCDRTGTTVYAGHAWRTGNGVADRWGSLRRGDTFRVAGCRFRVTKREFWSAKRPIRSLFRVDGPARVVLLACKADDYSKRTIVFARKIG